MIYYQGAKMSKSKGNVIEPLPYVERYGADALRLYIMFIGPADQDVEWQDTGIEGLSRFLHRLWRVVHEVADAPDAGDVGEGALARKTHQTIAKVTDDVSRRFAFNTPIAAVMELVNEISRAGADDPAARFAAETAVGLIQPWAPHIAEELWQRLGHERLWVAPWPVADQALLAEETFELVVQVNGRVRDRLEVSVGLSDDELVARAKDSPRVQAHVNGKEIRQAIVVPRKLVNLVIA
jgi:leucyl-tRNA synthetase